MALLGKEDRQSQRWLVKGHRLIVYRPAYSEEQSELKSGSFDREHVTPMFEAA